MSKATEKAKEIAAKIGDGAITAATFVASEIVLPVVVNKGQIYVSDKWDSGVKNYVKNRQETKKPASAVPAKTKKSMRDKLKKG